MRDGRKKRTRQTYRIFDHHVQKGYEFLRFSSMVIENLMNSYDMVLRSQSFLCPRDVSSVLRGRVARDAGTERGGSGNGGWETKFGHFEPKRPFARIGVVRPAKQPKKSIGAAFSLEARDFMTSYKGIANLRKI